MYTVTLQKDIVSYVVILYRNVSLYTMFVSITMRYHLSLTLIFVYFPPDVMTSTEFFLKYPLLIVTK